MSRERDRAPQLAELTFQAKARFGELWKATSAVLGADGGYVECTYPDGRVQRVNYAHDGKTWVLQFVRSGPA